MKSNTLPHWFKTVLWDKFFPITDEPTSWVLSTVLSFCSGMN
jgi:hypothetical protein